MFTGIIEEIGIVKQLVPGKVSYRLTVSANKVLEGTQVGDSIQKNQFFIPACRKPCES